MLHHFVDGTLVQEVRFRNVVVLALDDLLEGTDGLLQGNILTGIAGELLCHMEGLRQEALNLTVHPILCVWFM